VAVGLNVMLNVQLAPAAITGGQLFVCAKSAKLKPFILAETGSAALPVFVKVTVLGGLVVLTV